MDFRKKLSGHDDQESLRHAAEEIVEEMVKEHFSECYPNGGCTDCANLNPLDGTLAAWEDKAETIEELIEVARGRAEEVGGDPQFLEEWIVGYYHDEWYFKTGDGADCPSCERRKAAAD